MFFNLILLVLKQYGIFYLQVVFQVVMFCLDLIILFLLRTQRIKLNAIKMQFECHKIKQENLKKMSLIF